MFALPEAAEGVPLPVCSGVHAVAKLRYLVAKILYLAPLNFKTYSFEKVMIECYGMYV